MAIPRVKLKSFALGPMALLITLFLYVAPAHAFFRHLCFGELGNGRVDPIMAPGQASQHLHVSFGASNFGLDPTLDDLLSSNCTSCSITQDHSVYWAPRMYFEHSNGTFEMIPTSGGMTVYYFTESGIDNVSSTAFPQNFRMIAGNSVKRAFYGPDPDPPMAKWTASDMTQQALMEKALGFNCLNYSRTPEGALEHHGMRDKSFIDATCAQGVRAEIVFPSCWNGKDLDSDNHTTHVAYPSEIKYGICPEGYPVKLPILFYETIYQTDLFAGIDGRFVFSNGDPTGYGYHGDFMCGWEEGVLQNAIDNTVCTGPSSTGIQEACPIFSVQDSSAAVQCKMEVPEALQTEPINMVQELPGKMKVQAGPEPATIPGAAAPTAASQTANSTVSNEVAQPTSGLLSASATVAATTSSNPNATTPCSTVAGTQTTVTTTYMSGSMEVHEILVEDIVTVTVSEVAAQAAPSAAARHKHRGIHRNGHAIGLVRP
ncbi:hypothetical protein ABEF95_008525 [Exophiala dermatitidis]